MGLLTMTNIFKNTFTFIPPCSHSAPNCRRINDWLTADLSIYILIISLACFVQFAQS